MNDPFIDDLKNRTDIVEVIRKYTEIKKSGKNFMAKSPFRNERTPSFSISPDKQVWYDFGASEGGDVITFLEKIENISFHEAVEILAEMAGVTVPKNTTLSGPSQETKKDLFQLHQAACAFFIDQLKKSKKTVSYLKDRELSDETMKIWQLGFGGATADGLSKYLRQKGFSEQLINQSGVAFEQSFGDKRMKDRFAERLMIPIQESRYGDIVAFGGRDLSGEKGVAKYINSPENPVYNKSQVLFGLWQAKKTISKKDFVILVEGYFDVISAHQSSFLNTVATCGTALTEEHLRMIKRLTKNIYLAFDSDAAGKKATLRGVELCLQADINPFIVDISEGKDLDELARTDVTKLKDVIKKAESAPAFLLQRFAQKLLDKTIAGEKKLLDAFFPFLKLVNSPLERDFLTEMLAQLLSRSKAVIEAEFQKYQTKNPRTAVKSKYQESTAKKFSREEVFVGFVCSNWKLFGSKISENLSSCLTSNSSAQNILNKKIKQVELPPEEKALLLSWEMYNDTLYKEEPSEAILQRDFEVFLSWLNTQKEKVSRREQAKKIWGDMGHP